MTDIDYPPTREIRLGAALDQAESRVEDTEEDSQAVNQRDALAWAVDQWGDDATMTLEAYTAGTRAETIDRLRDTLMGSPGQRQIGNWLIAAGITDAPWIDDKDIVSKAAATEQLPPALVDWIETELDELNDLSEGN